MRFWMEYEMDKSHYFFLLAYTLLFKYAIFTPTKQTKNLSLALYYKKESKYRGKNNEGMETLWIKK